MSKKDIPYFLTAIALAVALVTINYREEPIPQKRQFDFQQAMLDRLDQMNQIEFMQTFK